MLKLENVSKAYRVGTFGGKELRAVSNVSFEVGEGEVVSLIGESGSGKSTIGKMILRLISISSGKIYFKDKEISTLKGSDLKTYYQSVQGVFQDPFSSYNPIFKADRIFQAVKQEYFPDIPSAEWIPNILTGIIRLTHRDISPSAVVIADNAQGVHPTAIARSGAPAGPPSRIASR